MQLIYKTNLRIDNDNISNIGVILMKVLFVATVVKKHIMEFHIPFLKLFKDNGWETAVAARNDYDDPSDCVIPYCDHYYDIKFERSPYKTANFKAYKDLKKVIDQGYYDIIHCHTPVGGALCRIAAGDARRKGTRVYYTAHGFHFYKGAPLTNWLVFYPIERWLAHKTDVLITINKEDYNRAIKFKAGEIVYVPGVGIDLNRYNVSNKNFIKTNKRKELGLGEDDFIMLSVGELNNNKNHNVVLKAIALLKGSNYYSRLQYIVCGTGDLEKKLKDQAFSLNISDKVHFLGYRNDVPEICKCADAFIFMSFREGLPVAMMEAMACGLPVICTNIRGNSDLVTDGINGLFSENDPIDLAKKIIMIQNKTIRDDLATHSAESAKKYDISCVLEIMKNIYHLS